MVQMIEIWLYILNVYLQKDIVGYVIEGSSFHFFFVMHIKNVFLNVHYVEFIIRFLAKVTN